MILGVLWVWIFAGALAWIAWCAVRAEPAPDGGPPIALMATADHDGSPPLAATGSPVQVRTAWRAAVRASLRGDATNAASLAGLVGWPVERVRSVLRAARELPGAMAGLASFDGGPVAVATLGTTLNLQGGDLALLLQAAADVGAVDWAGPLVRLLGHAGPRRRGIPPSLMSVRREARSLGLTADDPLELCELANQAAKSAEGEHAARFQALALKACEVSFRLLRQSQLEAGQGVDVLPRASGIKQG